MTLPIDPILPDLVRVLHADGQAVLQAPPGAGKTTRVPLALAEAFPDKIIMLEPRRIAARAAAERLAEHYGEEPGATVGYRMRGQSVAGKRIEVVTEGVLTRMIQSDPELSGVGTLIFDEFHERSLNADLGLALALEVREVLRPDLRLLVMSATLDAGPVAELMGGQVLTSEGRSFPVDIRRLPRPLGKGARLAEETAALTRQALAESEGSVLVFLPGVGEINRVAGLLDGCGVPVLPLHGGLKFADQQKAIRPTGSRRVILSTSIAETSLTIDDIRVVVDAGRARRARFDPATGMSRLVTERVTRAEATQRAGRAGRVAPGMAYRLWAKAEEGAAAAHPPPEIAEADLTGLALELAAWGAESLPFLTPPPERALAEARGLLRTLGALDDTGITAHGQSLAKMPLHPRLAHMMAVAGPDAAPIAALLSDRDPMRGRGADLGVRLKALERGELDKPTLSRLRGEVKRLRKLAPEGTGLSEGQMAALAYPDRIGQRRAGDAPRFLLSGGRGAVAAPGDGISAVPYLVALDLDGEGRDATIRLALPLTLSELLDVPGVAPEWEEVCAWSAQDRRVVSRRNLRLGALALDHRKWDAPGDMVAAAMADGVKQLGLRLSPAAERFRARVALLPDLPDLSDEALLADTDWLLPYLTGTRTADQWKALDLLPALQSLLDWPQTEQLNREVPGSFTTPLGRDIPIDYGSGTPEISVRLQEMFGVTQHPTVAGEPLKVSLLSPAGRPVQVTMDLPGFWTSSYADVRKDMRGRYPKHPWPEDPTQADPTLRTKRRG